MTYSRSRLLLGITCVGFWVIYSVFLFILSAESLLDNTEYTVITDSMILLAFIAMYNLVMFPFEVIGGYAIPATYNRNNQTLFSFVLSLIKSSLFHALIFLIMAVLLLTVWKYMGAFYAFAFLILAMLLLLVMQLTFLQFFSGKASAKIQCSNGQAFKCVLINNNQVENVGGIFGFPGMDTIAIPHMWYSKFPQETIDVECIRREGIIQSSARFWGVTIALLYNTFGLGLIFLLLRDADPNAFTVICQSTLFSVWNFTGLLILPSLSRGGVYVGDTYALKQGVDKTEWKAAMTAIERTQGDETSRSKWIQCVFHPTPSLQDRLDAVDSGYSPPIPAWGTSRMMLYLSWAGLGLLSRAVHSNCGLTEQWVSVACD